MAFRKFDNLIELNNRPSIFYTQRLNLFLENNQNKQVFNFDKMFVKWFYNNNESIPCKDDFIVLSEMIGSIISLSSTQLYDYLLSIKSPQVLTDRKYIDGKTIGITYIIELDEHGNNVLFALIHYVYSDCIQYGSIIKRYLEKNNLFVNQNFTTLY